MLTKVKNYTNLSEEEKKEYSDRLNDLDSWELSHMDFFEFDEKLYCLAFVYDGWDLGLPSADLDCYLFQDGKLFEIGFNADNTLEVEKV